MRKTISDKAKRLIFLKLEESKKQCKFKQAIIPPGWACVQTKVFSEEMAKILFEEDLIIKKKEL